MIKFLLLALLGLGLGGGVWKAQNPDGTLDDLKIDSLSSLDRLKSGVEAGVGTVVNYPQAIEEDTSLEERLSQLEGQVNLPGNPSSGEAEPSSISTGTISELENTIQNIQTRSDEDNDRLTGIDEKLEELGALIDERPVDDELVLQQTAIEEDVASLKEQFSGLTDRMDTLANAASDSAALVGTVGSENVTVTTGAQNSSEVASPSSSIMSRLDNIEEQVLGNANANPQTDIQRLNEQLAAAEDKIAQLEQQDAQATQSMEALSTSVSSLSSDSESASIENIQTQIREVLSQSDLASGNQSSDSAAMERLLNAEKSRIDALEERVQALTAATSPTTNEADAQSQNQSNDVEEQQASLSNTQGNTTSSDNEETEENGLVSTQDPASQDGSETDQLEAVEYKIYFERNSADVSDDAAKVLDSFIIQEQNRTTGVSIFGFTDRRGSAEFNKQLALSRASNVRSYLIQNGMDFTLIRSLNSFDSEAAATQIPSATTEAEQRVVVLLADQPTRNLP